MKSYWTERYIVPKDDLVAELKARHPDWNDAAIRAEAQGWLDVHACLDHEDYNQDRLFHRRQKTWENPYQATGGPPVEEASGDEG